MRNPDQKQATGGVMCQKMDPQAAKLGKQDLGIRISWGGMI
jgi:hypothetical protein